MANSDASSCPKSLTVCVKDIETVFDLKRMYAQNMGVSETDVRIKFHEEELEDDQPLHSCGIRSGELLSLKYLDHPGSVPQGINLAVRAVYEEYHNGTITVIPKNVSYHDPVLPFKTLRLSCHSDKFNSATNRNYAGIILYGCEENGRMTGDWRKANVHCKTGYVIIKGTDVGSVRYIMDHYNPPGVVHGAVYWSVFGINSDVNEVTGEGFACQDGRYKWNSGTFNAHGDAYHDGMSKISYYTQKCLTGIMNDWKKNSVVGVTYYVKDFFNY